MKKRYSILATALLISIGAFAQKDEFKTLKKIYEKDQLSTKDLVKYKEAVAAATPLVSSTNEEDSIYLNFYKAGIPFMEMLEAMTKPENLNKPQITQKYFTPEKIAAFSSSIKALLDYEKKTGKAEFTKSIKANTLVYKPSLVSYAVTLGDQKRFVDASSVLYSIYELDSTDVEKLYYAAGYAVNGKDFSKALGYYLMLKELDYSGEKMNYIATSKLTDSEEYFSTKDDRDKAISRGTHINAKDEKEPSKRGEIYKNIALIYLADGKIEEAKSAITEARKANPDDISLILTQADVYLKTNDMKTYASLINEVLEKDPTNAELVYNLGVISGQNKDNKNAEKYYLRAIELDPKMANAYLNLSAVRLDDSQLILDEMNKLTMSASDTKKYDVLKGKRVIILKEVIQLLEKTISIDNTIKDAKEVLLTVYKALEMKEKANALEADLNK